MSWTSTNHVETRTVRADELQPGDRVRLSSSGNGRRPIVTDVTAHVSGVHITTDDGRLRLVPADHLFTVVGAA